MLNMIRGNLQTILKKTKEPEKENPLDNIMKEFENE